MHNLGQTRSSHQRNHLLLTPDTFVRTALPGMKNASAIVHIGPALGAGFSEYTAEFEPKGELGNTSAQRFLYVMEGALTLEDYWVRRSARAWFAAGGGLADLAPAADAMAPLLGWTAAERDHQVAACHAIHNRNMAFAPEGAIA